MPKCRVGEEVDEYVLPLNLVQSHLFAGQREGLHDELGIANLSTISMVRLSNPVSFKLKLNRWVHTLNLSKVISMRVTYRFRLVMGSLKVCTRSYGNCKIDEVSCLVEPSVSIECSGYKL